MKLKMSDLLGNGVVLDKCCSHPSVASYPGAEKGEEKERLRFINRDGIESLATMFVSWRSVQVSF